MPTPNNKPPIRLAREGEPNKGKWIKRQQPQLPCRFEQHHAADHQQQQGAQFEDCPEEEEIAEHTGKTEVGAVHDKPGEKSEEQTGYQYKKNGVDVQTPES